ncbi:Molecular chaperone GrpE (heat shock protein) [Rubrobacter radiotolerans]|uniref:Protein GrpE n=1 Tax=Rubrobacter radiotolerans TaxID=42256 RepID=A0A023X161_RUBRA|nr:nucleotide exchange factor GrpE [Rubrobacter radiotolerans]AHY45941.1 Molecular chaperone GrpE (heat shock protein) [Rubrobacter radiotolerans]MDX5893355.1 nucleotide exchange factor GrpE [Rubrobacter radiotolerans]SMC03559.1 molecular chaperone GrpE [Rubrobacter radiotolerans DSM 5868]
MSDENRENRKAEEAREEVHEEASHDLPEEAPEPEPSAEEPPVEESLSAEGKESAGSVEEAAPEPEETPAVDEVPAAEDEELLGEESSEVEALRAELEAVQRERDEYLDSLRRLKAEFDNSRKRLERERERILQSASERMILALLPVLDNLDRALESEGDVREGVRATRDQLSTTLAEEGLEAVDSDGERFDPSLHEAVMSQPSEEHEEGIVVQTFERGYTLNGRSIRAAKVVVSQ